MADRTSSGGAAGGGAPELTLLNVFATPLVIAAMPDAEALNAGLGHGSQFHTVNFSLGGA